MFVSRKSLKRRTLLRGLGTAIGLPFLDAMVPAFTPLANAAANPRLRFGVTYFPNGPSCSNSRLPDLARDSNSLPSSSRSNRTRSR